MGNIGILGRARSGKDTAAQWLIEHRGYRRIAFADPLKAVALKLDPIAWTHRTGWGEDGTGVVRIAELVRDVGWERAKETPEVRRILQELGAAMRDVDPDVWIRPARAAILEANEAGVPVVVTDVRYPNEVTALRGLGFHLIHVERPGTPHLDHPSEHAVTPEDADFRIVNSGPVGSLYGEIEAIASTVYDIESRRHYARSLS
ncbi:hypothetical protein [Streptomyces tsukubensis]|uniref:deoxynucleotide monophosphate kinase family protein n=1 Tax=Streptomyces tsukubensis TaxID=83656 RepID=UPI003450CD9C